MKKKIVAGSCIVAGVLLVLLIGVMIGRGGGGSAKELTFSEFEETVRNSTKTGKYYQVFDNSSMGGTFGNPDKVYRAKTSQDTGYNSSYYVEYCVFSDSKEAKEAVANFYERRKSVDNGIWGSKNCFRTINGDASSYLVTRNGNIVMVGYAVLSENIGSSVSKIFRAFGFKVAKIK